MTQIIPINRPSKLEIGPTTGKPSELTTVENQVVIAKEKGKLIRLMDKVELVMLAGQMMDKAKTRLQHKTGYTNEQEMLEMLVLEFGRFPGLTDLEIRQAMAMGLNGDFYKGKEQPVLIFSPSNAVQWIKDYINSVKAPTMKKLAIVEAKYEEKPIPPLSEQNAMLIKGLLAHFEKMKADPSYTFIDYGNAYHSFLTELGIKLATKERRWKIYEEETQAMKLRLSEIQNKKAKRDWLDAIDQLELKSAKEARQMPDNDVEIQVIIACKKRVLLEYLRTCIEFEMDLEEIITDRL